MQPVTEGNPERPRLGLGSSPSTGRPLSHRCLTARHGRVADSAWLRRPLPARPARRPAPGTSSSFCPGGRWQHFAGMPFPRPLGAFRGFHQGSLVAQDFLPDRPSHSGLPLRGPGTGRPLATASCGLRSFRGPAQAVTATLTSWMLPGPGFSRFFLVPAPSVLRPLARDRGELATCWWQSAVLASTGGPT